MSQWKNLLVIKTQAEFNFIEPYAAAIIDSYGHANITYREFGLQAPSTTASWWYPGQPNFLYSNHIPHIQACGTVDLGGRGVCMCEWSMMLRNISICLKKKVCFIFWEISSRFLFLAQ